MNIRRVAVAALLATTISAPSYAQAFKPPTPMELWELRSKCAALGEEKRQENREVPANISTSYNPTDNRCYLKTEQHITPREAIVTLYDAQTGDRLASATHLQGETRTDRDTFDISVNDKRYALAEVPYDKAPNDPLLRDQWYHQVEMDRYFAVLDYMDRLMNGGKP